MTTERDLQGLLATLATGGCWPVVNTSPTVTYPYIVFMEVVSVPETLDESVLTAKRFQIDCFAKSYGAAKALANAVRAAIAASSMVSAFISAMDGEYNPVTKDFQVITEFTIWSSQ